MTLDDLRQRLTALREQQAERFDATGLFYLTVLSERAAQQHGLTRQRLEEKLARALAAYESAFKNAHTTGVTENAPENNAAPVQESPFAALAHYREQCRQQSPAPAAEVQPRTLEERMRALEQETLGNMPGLPEHTQSQPDLQAAAFFRELAVERQQGERVEHAISNVPENAGPLNSQMLVIRSLKTMRDVSPEYLNRFVTYVDTLLWLGKAARNNEAPVEKAAPTGRTAAAPAASATTEKKKTVRGRKPLKK